MKSASPQLRIGFLGVGSIARYHAEVLRAMGHVVSVGAGTTVESPRWRAFKTEAAQARFESNVHAVLEDPDIDMVVSCLPWNVTETWLPELLSTPKPVLLEKPIALSSEALSSAMGQAEATLHNKYIGFNRRFYRTVQKLRERVAEGGMKSVEIVISETVAGLAKTYGEEIIDHVLVYSSCHILDIALHILGALQPIKIYGYEDQSYARPFRSLTGLLETGLGAPVFLTIMAENPVPVGLRIFFDDRTTWHLSPLEHLVAYREYELIEPTPDVKIRRYIPKPFLEINEGTEFKPGFWEQMKAFTTGDGHHISATPEESLELLRLIETIQRLEGESSAFTSATTGTT